MMSYNNFLNQALEYYHLHDHRLFIDQREMSTRPLDPKTIIQLDGYLEPNAPAIVHRHDAFRKWKDTIEQHEGGYDNFTKGYLKFGFNIGSNGEVVYREWAHNPKEAYLIGDFSEFLFDFFFWPRENTPLRNVSLQFHG